MLTPPQRNFGSSNMPVLAKTADAYKMWHNILPHIPRLIRYSLGEKINLLFIELLELIFTAGFAAKEHKLLIVQKACIKSDALKFFLQIAWELKAMDNKKFAELGALLVEIGKMLGGWQRQLTKEAPPR